MTLDLIQQQVQKHVLTPCILGFFFPSVSLLPWSRSTQILGRNVPAQITSKDVQMFSHLTVLVTPGSGSTAGKALLRLCLLFALTGVYQPQAQSVSAFMSCQWVALTTFTASKNGRAGSTLYCLEKQVPNSFLSIFFIKILMKSHFTTLDKHTININIFNLLDEKKNEHVLWDFAEFFLCQ